MPSRTPMVKVGDVSARAVSKSKTNNQSNHYVKGTCEIHSSYIDDERANSKAEPYLEIYGAPMALYKIVISTRLGEGLVEVGS